MEPTLTDWTQALSSVLTMGAAIAAIFIVFEDPKLAASYVEQYRRETAVADEQRQF